MEDYRDFSMAVQSRLCGKLRYNFAEKHPTSHRQKGFVSSCQHRILARSPSHSSSPQIGSASKVRPDSATAPRVQRAQSASHRLFDSKNYQRLIRQQHPLLPSAPPRSYQHQAARFLGVSVRHKIFARNALRRQVCAICKLPAMAAYRTVVVHPAGRPPTGRALNVECRMSATIISYSSLLRVAPISWQMFIVTEEVILTTLAACAHLGVVETVPSVGVSAAFRTTPSNAKPPALDRY